MTPGTRIHPHQRVVGEGKSSGAEQPYGSRIRHKSGKTLRHQKRKGAEAALQPSRSFAIEKRNLQLLLQLLSL